ncbi:HAD hydrolase-like protein [Candidatus Saccharibacteria bacterium]|nr:MAG: HAD hydrolase-like protein [Candidatus Saccharibacteria bacterium]
MTKKIIAIDADDTLFDENTAVRHFMNNHYGFKHTAKDYLVEGPFDNYWENIWHKNSAETTTMYEEFVVSSYKENLKPITGALSVLNELNKQYDLVIVTSRDQRGIKMTHSSLALHYPNIFSDVHFVPLWGDGSEATKAKICSEIGASYLIDDCFEHCLLAAEAGISAILFGDYGWNRQQNLPKGIIRCKDWEAVRRALCGK